MCFLSGCNFRCGYCHNAALLAARHAGLPWDRIERALARFRQNWVDAVVLTGGEPTLEPGLPELICRLKQMGFARLCPSPVPHPLEKTNGRFVGSQKCESCHEKSYDIWKKRGHAHAYNTIAKLDPPRNFDPECVSCHVVGWNPNKFFPYESGYQNQEKTPHLVNVGCEDCHGPGEKHAAAELSGSEALRQQLRKAMVLTQADAKKTQCLSCHDQDNSPEFNFELYWPFVKHHEKDQ